MSKILRRRAQIFGLVGSAFVGGWCSKSLIDYFQSISSVSAKTLTPYENPNVPSIANSTKAQRISQIMKYGFPSLDSLRSFDDFVLSYDRRNRTAYWVFEHLTKENTAYSEAVNRSKSEFFEDDSIHEYFRGRNSDYKYSGYDRGHLAAAGNHKANQKHLDQTFVLSNISPQVGAGFNRDKWAELEKHSRKLLKQYPNVYVCTGPLYLPMKSPNGKKYVNYEVIGDSNVAVPTHFFKIIVAENENGKLVMENYVLPNAVISDSTPLTSFMVPLDSIQRAAGFLFFEKLDKSKLISVNNQKP
ncbi:hypothetical protein M8J76_003639 [Diaphorina citri]|nr:hypothetical protein M8J76_003639 [Diaphorina citri]